MRGRELVDDIASRLTVEGAVVEYEARVIASDVTGVEYSNILNEDIEVAERQMRRLDEIIEQRNSTVPLAYILKSVPFRELDLYVDQRVLIPRSETELVTEYGLKAIEEIYEPNVLDIGTGSGAIALSIAHEHLSSHVLAVDISADALAVAQMNCAAVGSAAARIRFMQSDLFSSIDQSIQGELDLIISNPPYIGRDEVGDLPLEVIDHEPHSALFSSTDGFFHIDEIMKHGRDWLKPHGVLVFEIAPRHAELIHEYSMTYGYATCEVHKDLSGRERIGVIYNS